MEKRWSIKYVPVETIRKIKAYAAMEGISIAEALTRLAGKIK